MRNAVIYTRVSTDEQALHGFSLPHQKEAIKRYCALAGINILMHFQDDFSAKTFDRPEFKKLEHYCKANRKIIDVILFTRWDRFSRQCEFALAKIRVFKNYGIEINAIEQPLDFSTPDHKIMLSIYLMSPEVENDKNSQRTTEGSRRARKEGCWTGSAPFGYDNCRVEGNKSSLIPNENSELVKTAFNLLSTGLYTAESIRKKLNQEGLKLSKQAFLNLIRNISYTGKIFIKAWKKEEEEIVEGLHEAIIEEDLFYHVQKILNSRNRLLGKTKVKHIDFPLRGHLECNICGGNLTASFSTSRNKVKHPYYHCQNGCKERFRTDEANKEFENLLSSLQFDDEIADLYKLIVKDVFSSRKGDKEMQISKLRKEITEREEQLGAVKDKYYSGKIDDAEFRDASARYQGIIRDKLAYIEDLKSQNTDALKHFNYCLSLIYNLKKHYLDSDIDVKNKLIGSIFPEKVIYSEKKYRTKNINSFFSLKDSVKADSKPLKMQKANISVGLSTKAPSAGLEPATL